MSNTAGHMFPIYIDITLDHLPFKCLEIHCIQTAVKTAREWNDKLDKYLEIFKEILPSILSQVLFTVSRLELVCL